MADTIFTRALTRAAALQGSKQALAYQLRVPEPTLLRWMSGRAQMPVQAFHRLIALLVEHEKSAGGEPQYPSGTGAEKLSFNIGALLAECADCRGTQFTASVPAPALVMTSTLVCASCSATVAHGELLAALAGSRYRTIVHALQGRPANARLAAADSA
jgi:hypothetical protein